MTILILTELFERGGLETHITGQVATLARQGERCVIATGSGPDSVPPDLFADGLFGLPMGPTVTFGELRETLKRLEDFTTRHAVKVVHAHPFYSFIIGALLARRLRLPYVATVHGPASLHGVTQPAAKAALTSCVLPGAARVYCVSPEAAELVSTMNEAEIRFLPNAVRIPPRPIRGEPGVWAWSGRLDADKLPGLLDLLEKLALAPPARLRIFGTGACRAELQGFIQARPEIAAFVQLEGWYADPMATLAGCELVAGMGRVLLEGGAGGLPCLLVGYDGVKGLLQEATIAQAAWTNFSGRNATTISGEALQAQIQAWRAEPARFDLRPWVTQMRDEEAVWSAYRADLPALPLREAPHLGFLDDLIRFSGGADAPAWGDTDVARAIEAVANPDLHGLRAQAAEARAETATVREEARRQRDEVATLREQLQATHEALAEKAAAAAAAQVTADRALEQERAQAESLRAELDRERARSRTLDAQRNDWQYRAEAMARSTSWRVTAPLRTASTVARIALDIRTHAKRVKWVVQISRERGWRAALRWIYGRLRNGRAGDLAGANAAAAVAVAHPVLAPRPSGATAEGAAPLSPAFALIQQPFDPYRLIDPIKPIPVDVLDQPHDGDVPAFSCVMTVFNEGASLRAFLDSLALQSATPSELILVDGGSSDDTVAVARRWAETSAFPVRVIEAGRVNIAEGRNIGARLAASDVILFADAGTRLLPNFCRNIVGAFDGRSDLDAACGLYQAEQDSAYSQAFIWDWSSPDLDLRRFLPSARALAVRATAFERAGGFPEHLTRTGEDTLFAIRLRQVSRRWAVCRTAVVVWNAPASEAEYDRLMYSYAYGDGESGFGDFRAYAPVLAGTSHELLPERWIEGYRAGRARRAEVEYRRRDIRRLVILLSGVPFTDSGGGQRCSQMAMAFARQNCKVVFVNIYPSFEQERKIYFETDLSLFEFYALRDFDAGELSERYKSCSDLEVLIISEFPHPSLIPVVETLKKNFGDRATTIYDYIDNWQTSLGWEWYSAEVEARFVAESDLLVASARTLRDQLQTTSGRPVELIPNAVNDRLFDRHATWDRPADLPLEGAIVTYTGAMWGDWFDWGLIEAAAMALPQVQFVLIGGVSPERRQAALAKHSNIHFLGLKPQHELPAYLAFSDAAIIPFTPGDVTTFVNPLKVYEYVAMAVPVVASSMPEVTGIPGVTVTNNVDEFCSAVEAAIRSKPPADDMKAFTSSNNWDQRIDAFLRLVRLPVIDRLQDIAGGYTDDHKRH
jgi:glycosyltransferase involved in cell wall biosynthesis